MSRPASTERSREVLLLAAIFLLALAVRVAFRLQYDSRYGVDTTRLSQLDSNTYDLGARIVLAGDLLQRRVYYPYHWWNEEVAPRETWESWYHPPTYHQTPLYVYFVAAVYALFGASAGAVGWIQGGLGAIAVLLVYAVGRRPFGRRTAAAAAIVTAVLGSLFIYDVVVLQESLQAFLLLLTAACFERALSTKSRARWWVASGASLGLAVLLKPNALPLLLLLLAWPLHPDLRKERYARRTAWILAGFVVVLLPVVARNVALGARPLAFTTRGPWEFVNGNASASTGVEWFPEETRETLLRGQARSIFLESQGSFTGAVLGALRTHAGQPLRFLWLQWKKLAAFFNAREIPNNLDDYVLRSRIPILAVTLGLWPLAPLSLLGIALSLRRFRERFVSLGFVAIWTLGSVAFYVLSRFRAPVLPFLALFAMAALAALVDLARRRRFTALGIALAALAALGAWTWPRGRIPGPEERALLYAQSLLEESRFPANLHLDPDLFALEAARKRPNAAALEARAVEVLEGLKAEATSEEGGRFERTAIRLLGEYWTLRGDFTRAESEFREMERRAPDLAEKAAAIVIIGNVRFQLRRFDEALSRYLEALTVRPEEKTAHYGAGRAYLELRQLDSSAAHLERAVAIDPDFTDAHAQLGLLYADRGEPDRALPHLRKGLVNQSSPAVARVLEDRIREIEPVEKPQSPR